MIWVDELDGQVRLSFTNSGPSGELIAIAYIVGLDEAMDVARELSSVAEQMLRDRADQRARVLATVEDLEYRLQR